MIAVGNTNLFAIESSITIAYQARSILALGYFRLHVGNKYFGVNQPDASLLACSYDEVQRRIESRGMHKVPFSQHIDGGDIADAIYGVIYGPKHVDYPFFGLSEFEIRNVVESSRVLWAPDGDQAFDDGSYVLHLDIGDRVRLIGFKVGEDDRHDPATLSDVQLSADTFYELLQEWRSNFDAAWRAAPKVSR